MPLIDVHAHLQDSAFDQDRSDVIERCLTSGFDAVVLAGTTVPESRKIVEMAESNALLWALVGVHPHEAKDWSDSAIGELEELLNHPRVLGIGEIGLDFHYNFSSPDLQRQALREQWALAAQHQVPVEVHIREAFEDFFSTIKDLPAPPNVLLHCYSGGMDQLETCLERGFHFSIGGTLTFRKAEETRRAFSRIPIDRIHLETDCPYLSPEPFRSRRNEPANLSHTLRKLAEVRDLPIEELEKQLSANARQFFGTKFRK